MATSLVRIINIPVACYIHRLTGWNVLIRIQQQTDGQEPSRKSLILKNILIRLGIDNHILHVFIFCTNINIYLFI